MNVIICGGRDYQGTADDERWLDDLHARSPISCVLSGKAPGADEFGARWARSRGIEVQEFPADWKAHGKKAGPLRNQQMVDIADAVIAFSGGIGTADCCGRAEIKGIPVHKV